MTYNLRHKSIVDYASLNDIGTDLIAESGENDKENAPACRYSTTKAYDIEIIGEANDRYTFRWVGYPQYAIGEILKDKIIRVLPPGAVNGPITLPAFFEILGNEIFRCFRGGNHQVSDQEVRIVTSADVIQQLLKAMNIEKFRVLTIDQFKPFFGRNFMAERIVNSDGDFVKLSTNVVACRVLNPAPEKFFLPVENGILVEHHKENNPVFCFKFTTEKESSEFNTSMEYM